MQIDLVYCGVCGEPLKAGEDGLVEFRWGIDPLKGGAVEDGTEIFSHRTRHSACAVAPRDSQLEDR